MDLEKILPEHREIVNDVLVDKFGVGFSEQDKQKFYDVYAALAQVPKKDWAKPSIAQRLDSALELSRSNNNNEKQSNVNSTIGR